MEHYKDSLWSAHRLRLSDFMKKRKQVSSDAVDEYGDSKHRLETRTTMTLLSPLRRPTEVQTTSSSCSRGIAQTPSSSKDLFRRSVLSKPDERKVGHGVDGGSSSSRKQVTFGGTVLNAKSDGQKKVNKSRSSGARDDGFMSNGGEDGNDDDLQVTHTSSSFEMAEKGASKVLIDSVQFQLDGLFSKNASMSLRRRSAWNLFELCHPKESSGPLFRSNSIMKALVRVVGLLLTEEDEAVEIALIALATLLTQRMDQKTSVSLPSNSFQALIVCSLDRKREIRSSVRDSIFGQPLEEPPAPSSIDDSSSIWPSSDTATTSRNATANSSIEDDKNSRRRIKRKFSGGKSASCDDVSLIPTLIQEECDSTYHGPADILEKLANIWPKMHTALCLREAGVTVGQTGQALSLSCVSSLLVSKAQACASIDSGYGRFSTSPSSRSSDRDPVGETLRKYQQSLSERPLSRDSNADLTYLQLCASQLIQSMQPDTSLVGRRAVQLWQLLGILHASCYRHAANQSVLCQPMRCTDREVFLPVELLHFFTRFAKKVTSQITEAMNHSDSGIAKAGVGAGGGDSGNMKSEVGGGELCDFLCRELIENGGCSDQDLFMASLKALVNLTHGSTEAASKILEEETAVYLLQMLTFFNTHLCTLRSNEPTSTTSEEGEENKFGQGILSPNEGPLENLVFSTTLNLISLMTNLVDSVPEKAEMAFRKGLLPINRLAIRLLISSSASFAEGLSESDKLKQSSLSSSRSLASSRPDTNSSISSASTVESSLAVTPNKDIDIDLHKDEAVPVADIVLSAHVCMLLFVIGCPNRPKVVVPEEDDSQLDNQEAFDAVTSPYALQHSSSVRDLLPEKSWWLPVRTLKAFLALQNSTGIFLCDNLVQVLEAIRVMELQDAAVRSPRTDESAPCGDVVAIVTPFSNSGGTPDDSQVVIMEQDEKSFDWLNVAPTNSFKSTAAEVRTPALPSKWQWDGSDLVTEDYRAISDKRELVTETNLHPHMEQSTHPAFQKEESFKLKDEMLSEWLNPTQKKGRTFGKK